MVAYHNTARIFGFQYIPLEEMDERLYGNKYAGPLIFQRCVEMLQVISDEIIQQFPEQVRQSWYIYSIELTCRISECPVFVGR